MNNRIYVCIDLKSFYASVECVNRNLDPLTTNLVVADNTRTEKTICLAITPSLKKYGLKGRSRLFEVVHKIKEENNKRKKECNYKMNGKSFNSLELEKNKYLEIDYIIAKPQMATYMKYSAKIIDIYLKYVSKDDLYVYSIDEVFIDLTNYLKYYKKTPIELTTEIIKDVYKNTNITATAGIGTNLFLAKVAMDVVAKHVKPNEFGVRIACLNEHTYRKEIWNHTPITDIWRVGKGIANQLYKYGIYTMGDIALCSLNNADLLYKLFGVNAELLIDHSWGYEPCTIKDIKSYKPKTTSISSGQVLHSPYDFNKAKIILKEMADSLSLDLVEKKFLTNQITLTINYDIENLFDSNIRKKYDGIIVKDSYGRNVPKPSHGTINLEKYTSSSEIIIKNILKLYENIVNPILLIRKINISFNKLIEDDGKNRENHNIQFDIFSNYEEENEKNKKEIENERNEKEIQKAIINIKKKYGKNSILKAISLEDGSTAIERNKQVGGHNE